MNSEYSFVVEWLSKEPDVENIIPYIKEQKEKNMFSPTELDALRQRVIFIKRNGHEAYLKASPEDIALQIFEGSKLVEDRKQGGCNARYR